VLANDLVAVRPEVAVHLALQQRGEVFEAAQVDVDRVKVE
jgi:hypothetical protein